MTSPISGGDKLTVAEEEAANEYIRNQIKIVPYQKPLVITAERDYVTKI